MTFMTKVFICVMFVFMLVTLPAANVTITTKTAIAGTNGQQLLFYRYNTVSYISWLRVDGTNQTGKTVTWSQSFNPAAPNFSLSNWWWKGRTYVQWRMSDGRTGSCLFNVPVSQQGDWRQVGVDYQPGNSCWFS